jgi:small subunit ribosomal protein S4e
MARHGNSRHIKRIAASSYPKISRKTSTYIAKPTPGRQRLERSIALVVILRDKLALVASKLEAKRAVKTGNVEINGKIVKDENYPIGFGDVIKIVKSNEVYRVSVAKGAVIKLEKLTGKDHERTLKVIGKYLVKGKKVMLRLYDGSAVHSIKDANVNDSVLMSGMKVKDLLKFQEGAKCFVVKGAHTSETGVISEIRKGSATKVAIVKVSGESGAFETPIENIMVVGA